MQLGPNTYGAYLSRRGKLLRQAMACITHRKSRSMQRLWCGEKMKKSQGYRIARTAARQSHGYGAEFRPLAVRL